MNWNQSNNNLFMQRIYFRKILHYGSGLMDLIQVVYLFKILQIRAKQKKKSLLWAMLCKICRIHISPISLPFLHLPYLNMHTILKCMQQFRKVSLCPCIMKYQNIHFAAKQPPACLLFSDSVARHVASERLLSLHILSASECCIIKERRIKPARVVCNNNVCCFHVIFSLGKC